MLTSLAIDLAEKGALPDSALRMGIRRLLRQRLRQIAQPDAESHSEYVSSFIDLLSNGPIAVNSEAANEQHYEVPADFYRLALGGRRKYSSCYFGSAQTGLDDAEEAMLALTCERAGIVDGQDILELGCGWGSLTLWMSQRYPASTITAVSNSHSQRRHITAEAERLGLDNLTVITADMNDFATANCYDRIVSVEMFEHMRNLPLLMQRISAWLKPAGRLFVHIFTHRSTPYLFVNDGEDDWMSEHFFTGGMMPSDDLLLFFQRHLVLEQRWVVPGTHYQRTAEAWLANTDRHHDAILDVFRDCYGPTEAARWFQRWRLFFLACAELWGFDDGNEWRVCHYSFSKRHTEI
jgi:cyclopropane-fatty-acyl-phospholipid synthase